MASLSFQNTANNNKDCVAEIAANKFSTITTRCAINAPIVYNHFPPITSMPPELKQDFSLFLNKPFLVDNVRWSTTNAPFTFLALKNFPFGCVQSGQLLAPFLNTAKYRASGRFIIQCSGTPQHAGTVLAAVAPNYNLANPRVAVNSFLQGPHAFLAANESTPAVIEIPFYSNSKLRSTTPGFSPGPDVNQDFAILYLMTLNQLSAPFGSSSLIFISVHVVFDVLDFYVPSYLNMGIQPQATVVSKAFDMVADTAKTITGDLIDRARGTLRAYTGLHNPNRSVIDNRAIVGHRNFTNVIDVPSHQEKLDPYANHDRIVNDPVFYTMQDEMLISNIISKPQYVTTITVTNSLVTGKVLFARPITPNINGALGGSYNTIPLQTLSYMTRMWRGDMELIIQSSMSNFHYCKLLVVKNYDNHTSYLNGGVPLYTDTFGLQTDSFEFSGGNQTQVSQLPFCSILDELPNCIDPATNAQTHGMVYIYLQSPLVFSGQAVTSIQFNIYIRAKENFSFYGYGVDRLNAYQPDINPTLSIVGEEEEEHQSFVPQAVILEPNEQNNLLNTVETTLPKIYDNKFQPIVSMRDFIRRYQLGRTVKPIDTLTNYCTTFVRVSDIVNDQWDGQTDKMVSASTVARNFFLGRTGGFKIKVLATGVASFTVRYVPPGLFIDSNSLGWQWNAIAPSSGTVALPFIMDNYYPILPSVTTDHTEIRCSAPMIENSMSMGMLLGHTITAETASTQTKYNGMNIVEFTLPQMNTLEFVGTGGSIYSQNRTKTYDDDMGTLVLTHNTTDFNGNKDGNAPVAYTFLYAYADEARCGFNVFSPAVQIENITAAGLSELVSVYQTSLGTPLDGTYADCTTSYIG